MIKFVTPFLILVCIVIAVPAKSQENWKLRKDKNGIKVFSRESKKYKFDELKVECEIEGRISQLAALLFDVNTQYKWAYKTKKSELLKEVNASDVFFYTEIECPWPYQNRDMVVHQTMQQNPANKVLIVQAKNADNFLPPKKDIVRLTYSNAVWTVTPINNQRFKIVYQIQLDMGENVPAWLTNLFAVDGPYDSFSNMRKQIKLPKYAQAKYASIVD